MAEKILDNVKLFAQPTSCRISFGKIISIYYFHNGFKRTIYMNTLVGILFFIICAFGLAGCNRGENSRQSNLNISNKTSPISSVTATPPTPEQVFATTRNEHSIELFWTVPGKVGIAGFKIYRDGMLLSAPTITSITRSGDSPNETYTANSFVDTGLSPHQKYTYFVVAYDSAGIVSAPSASVSSTTFTGPASK